MKLDIKLLVGLLGFDTLEEIKAMTEKLTQAIADLNAEVADSQGKLASIKTFIEGVPDLVGAAVADALAEHDVADDAAADAIDAAREAVSSKVDETLGAIEQNPAPGEVTEPSGGGGEETPAEPTGTGEAPAEPSGEPDANGNAPGEAGSTETDNA